MVLLATLTDAVIVGVALAPVAAGIAVDVGAVLGMSVVTVVGGCTPNGFTADSFTPGAFTSDGPDVDTDTNAGTASAEAQAALVGYPLASGATARKAA